MIKLQEIPFTVESIDNCFAQALLQLETANLETKMNKEFRFDFIDAKSLSAFYYVDTRQNMVGSFPFESLGKFHKGTKMVLENGHASYMQSIVSTDDVGFLFIPYPVLTQFFVDEKETSSLPHISEDDLRKDQEPKNSDLSPIKRFSTSLITYFEKPELDKHSRGKNFATCICSALNFYARHCSNLQLKNICRLNGGHDLFSWELEPITSIPQTTLTICPSVFNGTFDVLHRIDFDTLAELSPGFYHPTHTYNNTADVIGILNVKNTNNGVKRLILFIQIKDWFMDSFKGKHIIDEWRWSQQFVTRDKVFTSKAKGFSTLKTTFLIILQPTQKICVFIIFSANKIESITENGTISNVFFSARCTTLLK